MMRNNLLPVSQAGFKAIGCGVVLLVLTIFLDFDFLSLVLFIATTLLIFVYRNPEREILAFQEQSVLSPVDGKVVSIENIQDSEYAYKITINSSYTDIGVLRVPMNSVIEKINLVRGAKLAQNTLLASKINENSTLIFKDSLLNRVKVTHILKQSFADISISTVEAQNVLQTTRYGFMTNGLSTLYLPHNFRVNVSVGKEVIASETLIGYFS